MTKNGISTSNDIKDNNHFLHEIKKDLVRWREILLPMQRLLLWRRRYYPLILIGIVTSIFFLLLFTEPSVLTALSLLGLVLTTVDFVSPLIGHYLLKTQWSDEKELLFESVCATLLSCWMSVGLSLRHLSRFKEGRPNLYFATVTSSFMLCAWIGYAVNNLVLTYFIVLCVVMLPGLRECCPLPPFLRGQCALSSTCIRDRQDKIKVKPH